MADDLNQMVRERLLREAMRRASEKDASISNPTGVPEQVDMSGSGLDFFSQVAPWLLENISPAGQYLQSVRNLQEIDPRLTLHNMLMGRGGFADASQNIADVIGVSPPGAFEASLAKLSAPALAMVIGKGKPLLNKISKIENVVEGVNPYSAMSIPPGDPYKVPPKVIETATGPRLQSEVDAETVDMLRDGMKSRQPNRAQEISTSGVLPLEEANRLDQEETVKVYRAMQLIDGKLYPPMSAKVGGKLRKPTEIGVWERAEENPGLATEDGYFKLEKGNKKAIKARYNPYFHTSRSPLNDQFSEAYNRPNLVTVEVEIPKSELTSGYQAEKAKDAVGEHKWHSGPVSSKLPDDKKRSVILSRYAKVNRIVPDSEVASNVANMLKDENIDIPWNVVTPTLREELEKLGVPVSGNPEKYGFKPGDVNTKEQDRLKAQFNELFERIQ